MMVTATAAKVVVPLPVVAQVGTVVVEAVVPAAVIDDMTFWAAEAPTRVVAVAVAAVAVAAVAVAFKRW